MQIQAEAGGIFVRLQWKPGRNYPDLEPDKYRNGLWPMQYVFLIHSSAGGKKYVTRRSRVTYFLLPARERIKNTRPFLFLLLIYERFLTIFYAKFQRYFTQKHGTLFIADVVRH